MNITKPYPLRISLLALALSLSACNDQTTQQSDASQTSKSLAETLQDEDQQAALYDQADSLWYLENERAKRLAAGETTAENFIQNSPNTLQSRRTVGDYSFTPAAVPPVSRAGQLLNLPDPGATPRFAVNGLQWPANVGDLSISMWSKDKVAAFSLTIDDNHVQDHPFWYEMAAQYGWKWTWFLIANQVGWSSADHWGNWQKALDQGHDIQSHTETHLCDALFYNTREYRQPQVEIENNLATAKVRTLAYPFGITSDKKGSPCEPVISDRTKNSRVEAAKYYLAARDVYGALSSPAKLDYMKVPSVSAARNFLNAQAPWAYFDSVFNPSSTNYRTWYVVHYHNVPTDAAKNEVRQVLAHLKEVEDKVWVGTFTQVAKYGQEYATAKIVNLQKTANSLRFELKDQMNDAWFDEPLTLKLRLPDAWSGSLSIQQNAISRDVRTIQSQGGTYALFEVVPDRGVVNITY
ncbi:MAG TPA: polysaccharide deacetylase family protein [Thiolinea sp.]|nr:polysaccharide deacetylase family protein [Thiolinea sp.]